MFKLKSIEDFLQEKVDLEAYQKWNKEYDNLYNKVDLKSKELNDYLKNKKR